MKSLRVLLNISILCLALQAFAQQINSLNLSIDGEPDATLSLKEFLRDNPAIELPKSGTEFHIRLVEPDPSIDYRILNIETDPELDYTLRIINPENSDNVKPVYDEFVEELLRKYKQSQKTENE